MPEPVIPSGLLIEELDFHLASLQFHTPAKERNLYSFQNKRIPTELLKVVNEEQSGHAYCVVLWGENIFFYFTSHSLPSIFLMHPLSPPLTRCSVEGTW